MIAVVLTVFICACETVLDTAAKLNETDKESYDRMKCEHGYTSKPGVMRRRECVNDFTWEQNVEELKSYRIERDIYLEQVKN